VLEALRAYLAARAAWIPDYRARRRQRRYSGNGLGEKANVRLVVRRQKRRGMQWSVQSSDALAALRTLLLNDGWQTYWQEWHVAALAVARAVARSQRLCALGKDLALQVMRGRMRRVQVYRWLALAGCLEYDIAGRSGVLDADDGPGGVGHAEDQVAPAAVGEAAQARRQVGDARRRHLALHPLALARADQAP
jgi:hypothetical protein